MPAHTPPPLYSNSTTDTLIYDGNLNEYDVLRNYAHTHGNYLLTDSQFKLFEIAHTNNQTLISILLECNYVTSPQNLHIIRRLQTLQQYNQERTQEYYRQIITPQLTQRLHRQRNPNQQDTPSPMTVLSPSSSLSPVFSPPIASTSTMTVQTGRIRRQRRCYKCHQPFHNRIHCPIYRCQHCRKTRPGHLTRDCPTLPILDQLDQDYLDDYDPDGNLDGE